MARMRVYQLAKKLNVNTKELLDRMGRLGIQVKNHMSTLDEAAIDRIQKYFLDKRVEEVEEKRIGRRVIRRRRKVSELPADEAPMEVPPVPTVEPKPEEEPITTIETSDEEEVKPIALEVSEKPSELEGPESSPAPALEELKASEEIKESVQDATLLEETVKQEADQEEPRIVPEAVSEDSSSPIPEAGLPEKEDYKEGKAQVEETGAPAGEISLESVQVPEVHEPAEEEPQVQVEKEEKHKPRRTKRRRRKKSRRDEPARIIKLPDLIPVEEEDEEEKHLSPYLNRLISEDTPTRESFRKKKPRPETSLRPEKSDRFRASRKEVVEKEKLYSKKELAAQAERDRVKGKKVEAETGVHKPVITTPKAIKRRIKVDEAITVANLAKQMGVKAAEVIKKLLLLGVPATINQAIDFETAAIVASEFDFEVEKVGLEEEEILRVQEDRPEDLQPRPPVVTVMGHVDHGKTSLLDAIRHSNVTQREAGGITQHIGAYYVQLEGGDIVFLDTPGHEAFTAMRARGAKVTDIVVLVVAADDGVMQQTKEAINHAKAAGVTIIVAINKIDKPEANVERVKRELAENGLIPEEWGGDITMVEVSAKKRTGIEELLEMIQLQAELLELKANPNKPARGYVIEAKLDKGRGPVGTVLIKEGTLRPGDIFVSGVQYGRVRSMFNDKGQRVDEAGPSMPVEVLGFSGVPGAGDDFAVLGDEKQAKAIAENRKLKRREKELSRTTKITLERLYERIQEGEVKEINIILKCDVQGSLEAISDSLQKLSTPDVKVNLIHSGTGAITESDVMLASASKAIIIGFNVRADAKVAELAEQEKVDIRYYNVIYQVIADVKDAMAGLLEPIYEESVLGRAEVRQTFNIPRVGTVAGCYVHDGQIRRGARVRVLRDQVVIYEGKIGSLKRFKDDVKEVKAGFECGVGIENFNDVKAGDVLEAYELREIKPSLDSGEKSPGEQG